MYLIHSVICHLSTSEN